MIIYEGRKNKTVEDSMVRFKQMTDAALCEIRFLNCSDDIYGAKFSYSLDGVEWKDCCIFLGIDSDTLIESTFWEWNQAVRFGRVYFNGNVHTVYWNLFLNNLNQFSGKIYTCVEILKKNSVQTFKNELVLKVSDAVIINNWQEYLPEIGWEIVDNDCLTNVSGYEKPVFIKPAITGKYNVYFGIKYGIIHMFVKSPDEGIRYPFVAERNRPEFQNKFHKEIFWKTIELKKESVIEISPAPIQKREPEKYPFGAIHYIKFVPAREKQINILKTNLKWKNKTLALYFEPYSWAFFYNLDHKWQVEEAMKLYREMGANEIHNQIIRFGSKTLHHSNIVERHDKGAMMGDDGTFSPGPASMVRSLDVLKETIDVCRKLGMVHYANAGLTNCYPGTDFEERISREHPDWRTHNILRYNRDETRNYAAEIIKEFVEWGTDGISIDCMRYPYYHTEDDLIKLFYLIREKIDKVSNKKIPLTVRIPASDVTYYRVFEQLVRKQIVQCVVPSNLLSRQPLVSLKPYIKWRDYGCKVFGIIDGWLTHIGSFFNFQLSLYRNPSQVMDDIKKFFKEGADGIFVYQADVYCADPFLRNTLDWRKWRKSK